MERLLSQDEIDKVFRKSRDDDGEDSIGRKAIPYDFRRPDRIAKDQLRALHLLHDNFARNLGSSLSAYLRAYVVVNLVSVEQLSFAEFSQCLPSPTCMVSLGMRPFDGNAVMELNPSLVFPLLEMLLGGSGKSSLKISRETTEIEQSILDGLFRIILNDLKSAWAQVSNIAFTIESRETEPQLLQILAPNEAIVSIGLEIRIGDNSGMMNMGFPSIIIKMLRNRFDQQWSIRKGQLTEEQRERTFRLISPTRLHVDARLTGPTLLVEDMLQLKIGDVLTFDYPVTRPIRLTVNGKAKYEGQIVAYDRKRALRVDNLLTG
ncbi:MAG: flagellar motor switch protein FliM [Bryobacteraceae bacterium]